MLIYPTDHGGFVLSGVFMDFTGIISGFCTPLMLLSCGAVLSSAMRLHRILRPGRFFTALRDSSATGGQSPWKALTVALAGTLGVGNITGVAAAILQGGKGAVFWMWVGALFSMAVKYGEVVLAVRYRKRTSDGKWYGGMMYVIRDGLAGRFSSAVCYTAGGIFALLCAANALVTGTIVQSNAAADVLYPLPEWVSGILLTGCTAAALFYGTEKVGDITLRLVPGMTAVFMGLSLWIILGNLSLIPSILREIVRDAFSLRALGGGVCGMGISGFFRQIGNTGFGNALRYGITRGIFSNEAGCGTSPTAHASADTKSPFHQGCLGIFEVICDTLILCTMTALVICICDRRYGILPGGGANLTLCAYQAFGGDWVYGIMAGMVAVFAYAAVLAQMYYGITALGYFTDNVIVRRGYCLVTLTAVFGGAVMEPDLMWGIADLLVGIMTCLTTAVLFLLRGQIRDTVPQEIRTGKKDG